MKLFLASLASETLDLVLPLLPDEPKNIKLAFIPTAADPYPVDKRPWMVADRAKAVSLGFQITDYDIKGKSVDTLRSDLSQYQVIFVDGGNTYYLLDQIKKSGLDIVIRELLNSGVVYIGSSAGSCIMCSTIDYVELVEHKEVVPNMTEYDGLSLIDKLILPHYGRSKYADRHGDILAIKKYGNQILPLRDDQAVIVNGDETEIVTSKGVNI